MSNSELDTKHVFLFDNYFDSFVVSNEAFVTLATNEGYALGAMVLGRSLRRVATTRQLVIMVTRNLSQSVQ